MLSYHISIGYNGAIDNGYSYDEMWLILKNKTREICNQPHLIVNEALRLGSPEYCDRGCCHLDLYANNYADPFSTPGHPIVIIDENYPAWEIGNKERQIMQLASTGNEIKYHIRRAFVRLLIEAMHKERIEVSLEVV